MVDWIMYGKIQEMKRAGLNKSQTSRHLGIDYKTVLKYWDMSPDEYSATRKVAETRTKKADRYKDFVIECLQKYPDMSAAQIYDWIRERTCLETLEFQERAFRTYVKEIRNEYDLRKPEKNRQYEAVNELPMGKQAQVDMGEIILETMTGRYKKIYCFAMVMTHSRQKFALWQEKPFTTDSFIQAHIRAFTYYGGRPIEIVYDQDKILAVSENHGDIIYTEGFQTYVNAVRFDIFLCHGADPESKGKVENVVKYVKHGFAEHRIFRDIDSFNADCMAWLERTANSKKHGTTQKIPAEVFELEREHLIPVSEYSFTPAVNDTITYQVRKDNIVLYKGNRYRVPKGTYEPGKKVYITVENEIISIADCVTGEIYAKHPLCHEKGRLIGQKREDRDKSRTIKEQESLLQELFLNDELYHACEEGYKVSYTSMQSLMQVLRTCEVDRRSRAKMNRILKSNLLVVDEVGYLPITSVEGNLFFQLISQLQEQTSIIITTNKGFEEWAEFLDDAALATAILDRLSYRCDRIQMSGKSYRLENRKSFLDKKGTENNEIL